MQRVQVVQKEKQRVQSDGESNDDARDEAKSNDEAKMSSRLHTILSITLCYLLESPRDMRRPLAASIGWHAAAALQRFEYVKPSLPQTGSNSIVHIADGLGSHPASGSAAGAGEGEWVPQSTRL